VEGESSDVIVVCAPAPPAAAAADVNSADAERLAALGTDVDAFAGFVDGIRGSGLRHVAMYAAAPAQFGGVDAGCGAESGEGAAARRRALLFSPSAAAPAPAPSAAPYVCDDLCKVGTTQTRQSLWSTPVYLSTQTTALRRGER